MTGPDRFERALEDIEFELQQRLDFFERAGMDLEAHRLESKTRYDLDMLREIGHCRSVENYSMHFDGRDFGERPYCLLDFFAACAQTFHGSKEKFLVIIFKLQRKLIVQLMSLRVPQEWTSTSPYNNVTSSFWSSHPTL